ncbi:hypothetical protein ACQR16_27230 [Bradyrhizobium oligotrophicum]|uniref:hypothetical protein n=1 Tax=Bradyrhizobium oligotrophicum TaxID=44255 RepID=UPI003EB8DAF2
MSDGPPDLPPRFQPMNGDQLRRGCLTVFMVITGMILLLPGLCAMYFSVVAVQEKGWPSEFIALIVIGFAVGAGGVLLLRKAWRR